MTEENSEELTESEFSENIKENLRIEIQKRGLDSPSFAEPSDLPSGTALTKDGKIRMEEKPSRVRGGNFDVDVVYDARNCVYGRLASHIAKLALKGWSVSVINVEESVINGNPESIVDDFQSNHRLGSNQGPFHPKEPDQLFKKSIKGMLPHKKKRGRKALKRVRAFKGNPYDVEGRVIEDVQQEYPPKKRFLKLKEISERLGAK